LRCLECPLWIPKNEYSGLCLYKSTVTSANFVCKMMQFYTGKIVNGIPQIPDDMDYTTMRKVLRVLESKKC